MLTKLCDLAFEIEGDDINLEQDMGSGELHRITLHRVHLRHLAEKMGLVPAGAYANPDIVIERLARQLKLLHHRIDTLDDWIRQAAERGRDDLSEESTYAFATWEMSREFVADLDAITHSHTGGSQGHGGATPDAHATSPAGASTTERGLAAGSKPTESSVASRKSEPRNRGAQPDLLSGIDGKADATETAHATKETTP